MRSSAPAQRWGASDVDGIVAVLTEDVWLTMPPLPLEYRGPELAAEFLATTGFRPRWTAPADSNQGRRPTRFLLLRLRPGDRFVPYGRATGPDPVRHPDLRYDPL